MYSFLSITTMATPLSVVNTILILSLLQALSQLSKDSTRIVLTTDKAVVMLVIELYGK